MHRMGEDVSSYADGAQIKARVRARARQVTNLQHDATPAPSAPGWGRGGEDDRSLICELILDGNCVVPIAACIVLYALGAQRVCLTTDAVSVAGVPDGRSELARADNDVKDGHVYVAGTHILAGSTLTMDHAAHNAVALLGLDVPTAVAMSTLVPARAVRRNQEIGALVEGLREDLSILDADLRVTFTIAGVQIACGTRARGP
jgi:N-acetylglucosamine-6-phosphate deacetylase